MISNKTRRTVLVRKKKFINTIFQKTIGLMFSSRIRDFGLIFIFKKPCKISLHMFFVFFPIDVLFLDANKKVVELKRNFKPFSVYYPKNNFIFVLELPAKTIDKSGTVVGDTISW